MKSEVDIEERTFKFSLNIIKFVSSLDRNSTSHIIGNQLLRSGTSIGANVSEGRAAVSRKDFSNYLSIAKKSALETMYWLKLLKENSSKIGSDELVKECDQLIKIISTIIIKLK